MLFFLGTFWTVMLPLPAGLHLAYFQEEQCMDDNLLLCLQRQRFTVDVQWRDFRGVTGKGRAMAINNDTGFFDLVTDEEIATGNVDLVEDIDLIVRVFDGCQFNDHFWVFAGALTNVEFEITVTDTQSELTKTYSNPLGQRFQPIQDTQAFATCPSPKADLAKVSRADPAWAWLPNGTDFDLLRDCDAETFCFQNGRFEVDVTWLIPPNTNGVAQLAAGTDSSAAFSLNEPSSVDLYLKISDGRPINDHFWFSYASFTGNIIDMTVTDTETGATRTYHDPLNEGTGGIDFLFGETRANRVLYPWISNNNDFGSVLVINNANGVEATVDLEGRRSSGASETTSRTIPPCGFLEESAEDLFPELGNGSGYSVLLTSENEGVTGRWVTNNRATASGSSPSQGVAVHLPDRGGDTGANPRVGNSLLFGYLPLENDAFSAPVIVNVGDGPTDVDLFFFNQGGQILGVDSQRVRGLEPFRPFAVVTRDLIDDPSGNVQMVAHSPDQPLTGVVFTFNQVGEPAIGNAQAIPFSPPQLP